MRLKLALVGLGVVLLIFLSITRDMLPFFRSDVHYSDSVTAHWPSAVFFRTSLQKDGEFPLWRETTMAGQPFAANPLNKTAYPLQWLVLQPISISSAHGFHLNLLIAVHLLIAGSGMWLWTRSLGLRIEAALLAVVAYIFAPRMMGHLGA